MDQIDEAQRLEEQHLRRSLDALNQSQRGRISALHCIDCGEPIPERRRQAVPGVQKCIQCAE